MADPNYPNYPNLNSNQPPLSNPSLTPTAPVAEEPFPDGRPGTNPTPQLYPNLNPYLGENPNWRPQPAPARNPLRVNQSGTFLPKEEPQARASHRPHDIPASSHKLADQGTVIWEELSIDCHGWQMLGGNLCKEVEEAYEEYLNSQETKTVTLRRRVFDFNNFELVDVFGCVYPIRRVEYPSNSALANNIVWLWNDSDEGKVPDWKPYSSEIVNLLEKRFLEKKLVVDLQREFPDSDLGYTISFQNMVQINKKTKTQRRVRRDKLKHPFPRVKNKRKPSQTTNSSSLSSSSESASSQSRAHDKSEDEKNCKICMELKAEFAFIPCGHVCCCGDCAGRVQNCPMCRESIESIMRVYI